MKSKMGMFWKSGSTSNDDLFKIPKGSVLWVIQNGQVLASCVHTSSFKDRFIVSKIENISTGAAIVYGPWPVIGVGAKPSLSLISLDASMKVVSSRRVSRSFPTFPHAKTRVNIIMPEEILRRFSVAVGDQFELKS